MRLKRLLTCISGALAVLCMAGAAGAGATPTSPANSQVASLMHVGVSWTIYATNGNAPKACELQVEPSVGGVPCDQLPTYAEPMYCPAFEGDQSVWRNYKEQIVKPRVKGNKGSLIIRAWAKSSKKSGKAFFRKVGGKWKIVSFQSSGHKFAPPGLIFTEGNDLRKELWPLHC